MTQDDDPRLEIMPRDHLVWAGTPHRAPPTQRSVTLLNLQQMHMYKLHEMPQLLFQADISAMEITFSSLAIQLPTPRALVFCNNEFCSCGVYDHMDLAEWDSPTVIGNPFNLRERETTIWKT
jgi:hypothetical protein